MVAESVLLDDEEELESEVDSAAGVGNGPVPKMLD